MKSKLVSPAQTDELGRIYIARPIRFRIPLEQVVLAPKSSYSVTGRLRTGERVQQRVVKVNMPHRHRVPHRHPYRTLSIDFGNGQSVAVDLL